jgi:hypothetical protein
VEAVLPFRLAAGAADSVEEGPAERERRQDHGVGELLESPDLEEGHTSLEVRRKVPAGILGTLDHLGQRAHLDHLEILLGRSLGCASVGMGETAHMVGVDRMGEAGAGSDGTVCLHLAVE